MPLYLISYDINEKDAFEYESLWATLKEIGAKRILYSEWVVASEASAEDVYNQVSPRIQEKDRLLVQELGPTAVWDKLLIKDEVFKSLIENNT